jgi:hypothetical protein
LDSPARLFIPNFLTFLGRMNMNFSWANEHEFSIAEGPLRALLQMGQRNEDLMPPHTRDGIPAAIAAEDRRGTVLTFSKLRRIGRCPISSVLK